MNNQTRRIKAILITGVAGNIGSSLAGALVKKGDYKVLGVDNLSTGARHKPPQACENFRFIKADINNFSEISSIFYANNFDYVFHFAAVVGVQRTLENPLLVLNDIEGIKNILLLAKNCGVTRVFYSSSSEIYGEPVSLPQHETTTPLNSRLPYAIVKSVGEAYLKAYFEEHGLLYTIYRLFNTYGPNQGEDFVVPRFLHAALQGNPITIYGDGCQTRTFCYIEDCIDTMIKCLEEDIFVNEILNVGSDFESKIIEVAKLIVQITGSKSIIEHLPPLKEGDMTRRRPDITKMKQVLGRPLIHLADGINRMINHLAACSENSNL